MTNTTTAPDTKADDSQKRDFDTKHEKELGFKKFAAVQTIYIVVPLVTMAIGAFAGYKLLGKPLSKMFPKLSGIAKGGENAWANRKDVAQAVKDKGARLIAEGKSPREIMNELGIEAVGVSQTAKIVGATGAGVVGSMGGSVVVGYDKWRKEESARLAADEINHDIANLQLFKPSNPELVAENKRLRDMLADAPHAKVAEVKHEGKQHAQHHEASVG